MKQRMLTTIQSTLGATACSLMSLRPWVFRSRRQQASIVLLAEYAALKRPFYLLAEGQRWCSAPFKGGWLAEIEVHTSPGIGNIIAAIAARYVYECILGNRLNI
jgi:hypothetical protein